MKKTLLSFALMLTAMTAAAQPTPLAVEPGSKGQLPTVATPPDFTEPNRFAALFCPSTLGSDLWYSDRGKYQLTLQWAEPERFGGESYTLEYRYGTEGEWLTQIGDDNKVIYFDKESLGCGFKIHHLGAKVSFRLKMHGGSKDGYLSNEVSVTTPTMFTAYGGYGVSNEPTYSIVGEPLTTEYNLTVRAYDAKYEKYESYTNEDGVFRYKWYRQNPKTNDITLIAGANEQTYTPTMADVGYWLYCEISGDEEHCSFIYRYLPNGYNPTVYIPVKGAPAYYGDDGFVLNTDYVVPEPKKNLMMNWYEYDEETQTGQEIFATLGDKLTERKPGQYAVKMPKEKYEYNMLLLSDELKDKGFVLSFVYNHGWDEIVYTWYREAQLMPDRYMVPLTVKVTSSGSPVAATVDVLGTDIDGKLVVKASADTDTETGTATFEEGLYSLGDGYYVRAHAKGSSQDIYYPGATTQAGAQLVIPAYDEDWNPKTITIELQGGNSKQGDINGDGTVDVADIATVISVMASAGAGAPSASADVNGDGVVDVADIATIISIMAGK